MQNPKRATCLDGHAQAALDGAGRLRQDGQVRGPAAAAHGAAAAVEQRQPHAMPLRHLYQPLLSPEAGRVSAGEPHTPTTHTASKLFQKFLCRAQGIQKLYVRRAFATR